MKLNLIVGESTFTVTLYDNESTKDFVSLLPLTSTWTDYNRQERRCRLPKRLSNDGAGEEVNISAGDINYYMPFRNLCIYYQDSGLSFCQVPLGKIDTDGMETIRDMAGSGPVEITFEKG